MADDLPPDLIARVEQLEREVRDLRLRLATLERNFGVRAENSSDRNAVREKVSYDWQA